MNSLAKLSLLLSMSVICIAQNLSTGPLKGDLSLNDKIKRNIK